MTAQGRAASIACLALSLACTSLLPGAMGGSRDAPEIRDPAGDNSPDWLDIRKVWVEHGAFDVPRVAMQMDGPIPIPPDLGTGGMFNGAYFEVAFDLYDWNGTRIGDSESQLVALAFEETIILVYVCIWDSGDEPREDGLNCWSNGAGRVRGSVIQWDVDFKKGLGENWTVGSGYRFENLRAMSTLRALANPTATDVAGNGTEISEAPPTVYSNVRVAEDEGAPAPVAVKGGPLAAGIVVVTSILVGLGRVAFKVGRFRLLQAFYGAYLFTRIAKDAVLESERRASIYDAIQQTPGIGYTELKKRVALSSGTLVHHLSVLNRQGFVRWIQDGFRSRFYVRGARVEPKAYLSRTQESVLAAVGGDPGITQKQLAAVVGLPRQSLNYHAKRLARLGKLRVAREGRTVRHYPA